MTGGRMVTIGGAAGMWGDSLLSTRQLLGAKKLDYIIYECLAEITMAIMTRARQKSPELGYAVDVIDPTIASNLEEMRRQNIRVITNAGGVNPESAAHALREAAEKRGLKLKIATVSGDDMMARADEMRARGIMEMARGTPVPEDLISMNAYFGALPIADALGAGADVVITGRVVDSALVLGPLIHEFGWRAEDLDLLAQGSLAGHLLECGPQATGGLMTDWDEVPSWVNIGYPIAECHADGRFTVTRPDGTDGVVNRKSITEQILYEIGDPRAYILPDVVCDFSEVKLEEAGENRIAVSGARGRPPTPFYKVCGQEQDGYRTQFTIMIGGRDAASKARRVGESITERGRLLFRSLNMGDFRDVSIEVLGAESTYGPHARAQDSREVVLKLTVHHDRREALELFAREFPSIGLGMAQGITGGGGGRARPSPFIRLHSFLVPRDTATPDIRLEGEIVEERELPDDLYRELEPLPAESESWPSADGDTALLPLLAIAYARSGDKGDISNIGIAARHPDFEPVIGREVTAEKVRDWFAHLAKGPVTRYRLPGLHAFNFVLEEALGGGGTASLRFDPQGKAHGQMLLEMPVEVPEAFLNHPGLKKVKEIGERGVLEKDG